MAGYVLKEAEGRSYRWSDYLFTVKAGAQETQPGVAVMEFLTQKAQEPPPLHVHPGEDEMFYVLSGDVTITCGDERFEAAPGDFVFLPRDVPHSYRINSEDLVRFLVITASSEGGRRFGDDIERAGVSLESDDVLAYIEQARGGAGG